jgi:hypothetical protein
MIKYFSLITFLNLLLIFQSLPASENNWNISLETGEILLTVSLKNFSGDSLLIASGTETRWISIISISGMTKLKEPKVATGMGLGLLAGSIIGAGIGYATYEKPENTLSTDRNVDSGTERNAAAGAIYGGVIGMMCGIVFGTNAGKDEVYDLSKWGYTKKLNWIRSILPK